MHQVLEYLIREFERIKDPLKARSMEAYMKHKFVFYGIPATERKLLTRQVWKDQKGSIKRDWRQIVYQAWACDHREVQYAAMDLIGRIEKQLQASDLRDLEWIITHRSWWDTVDFLAAHAVGHILISDKSLREKTSRRYIASDNMWLQRTALIFQLKYGQDTDAALLFELIENSFGSKAFFINKAIGWSLRQYSKSNVSAVKSFIETNRENMASLSIKEASKYLN